MESGATYSLCDYAAWNGDTEGIGAASRGIEDCGRFGGICRGGSGRGVVVSLDLPFLRHSSIHVMISLSLPRTFDFGGAIIDVSPCRSIAESSKFSKSSSLKIDRHFFDVGRKAEEAHNGGLGSVPRWMLSQAPRGTPHPSSRSFVLRYHHTSTVDPINQNYSETHHLTVLNDNVYSKHKACSALLLQRRSTLPVSNPGYRSLQAIKHIKANQAPDLPSQSVCAAFWRASTCSSVSTSLP